MRVQNDTKVQTAASSTGTGTAATTGTVSFKELYTSRVQELWDDYKSTGLTAADQELKAAEARKRAEATEFLQNPMGYFGAVQQHKANTRGRTAARRARR